MLVPRNRKNLTELSDKVHALKSAIQIKLELDKEIDGLTKLANALSKKPLFAYLLGLISPNSFKIFSAKRKIESSKLRREVEVKTKARNIYHRNELALEDFFDQSEIYSEMEERFDAYLNDLTRIYNTCDINDESKPCKDIHTLYINYSNQPPKTKTDKLSFYLTMENLLARY